MRGLLGTLVEGAAPRGAGWGGWGGLSSRPPGPPPGGQGSRGADTARRGRPHSGQIPRRERDGSAAVTSLTCAPGRDAEGRSGCWATGGGRQLWQPPEPRHARSRGSCGGRGLTAPGSASRPRAPPPPRPRVWPRLLRPPPGSSSVHRCGGRGR
jgi:hypothetical protein